MFVFNNETYNKMYDPALGRFPNPDPLRYADPTGMFNQLPPQYKQRHLDPDTYDGEMLYELVFTGYRTAYWKGCGVFAPNAPYVDNYAFVLSNRYGQPQSPLPYGYGAPMGGGYPGASNSQNRKSAYLSVAIETTKDLVKSSDATYAWVKENIPVLKISTKGSKKIYGHTGHRVASLARGVGLMGKALTLYSIAADILNIIDSHDLVDKIDYGMDASMNAIGLIDNKVTLGVSIAWSLGGNELFYMWREQVLLPQVKDGTAGLMINQPFK